MRTISVFGKVPEQGEDKRLIGLLFEDLLKCYDEVFVWRSFYDSIEDLIEDKSKIEVFSCKEEIKDYKGILLSLGGDGTMLDTVNFVIGTQIAVLGVNLGHLGFLTTAGRQDMDYLVSQLQKDNYTTEDRTILEVSCSAEGKDKSFAVNEACFLSTNRGSIIDLEVFVENAYVSTYSADGLIVATSTGSTAYSMAAGGPIICPDSPCICLTPIAPHNLTFRPIIMSEDKTIRVHIPRTDNACKMLVDGYSIFEKNEGDVFIRKSAHSWHLARLENQDFFKAIRDKLMWGTMSKYMTDNL